MKILVRTFNVLRRCVDKPHGLGLDLTAEADYNVRFVPGIVPYKTLLRAHWFLYGDNPESDPANGSALDSSSFLLQEAVGSTCAVLCGAAQMNNFAQLHLTNLLGQNWSIDISKISALIYNMAEAPRIRGCQS